MKKLISSNFKIFVYILLLNCFLQGQGRVHDSLIIRAILDSNYLWDVEVDEVAHFGENDSGALTLTLVERGISYIPSIIGQLKMLSGLWVAKNELLESLPKEICELDSILQEIRVNDNKLTSLPECIVNFPIYYVVEDPNGGFWMFNTIYVNGNMLCSLSTSVEEWLDAAAAGGKGWRDTQDCPENLYNYNKKRIINNKALENKMVIIDKKRFIVPDYNYSIYDINGRLIGNYRIYDNKTSPNISFGNYILKLKPK